MAQSNEQHETIIINETSTEHAGAEVVEVITVHTETTTGPHTATEAGEESLSDEIFEAILDPFAGADDASHTTVEFQEFVIVEHGHDDAHALETEAHAPPVEELNPSADADHALHTEAANEDAAHTAEVQAEAEAHASAATEAQDHADAYVAAGDYAAAAQERESAEHESWDAGHNDMLHGSTSAELSHAADEQHQAAEYEQQEAQYAAAGNYEAAQDAAGHAVEATVAADFHASGSDHSGQARQEEWHEGWAVSEQHNAEADIHTAEYFAANGNAEAAETHLAMADEHMASADHQGDLGQHDGPMAEHDHTSDVAHDSSHDAYDAGHDVSHDASHDASYDAHSYDAHETDV